MTTDRVLTFSLAINEALHQSMSADARVMLLGQGVRSPWYVGNTALGLSETFGPDRVIDTPVSENAMTGAAVGAAIAGMRPVVVHPRMDFMVYALDPIINQAANWHYMSGGAVSVPVVVWGIINRGGEQAAQHSQALHSILAHFPGLKVVAPARPRDAKGLMIAAIRDPNPVVFVDDRWLYSQQEPVPVDPYETPIGSAEIRREGEDVSIIAFSHLVPRALEAAERLARRGIDAEVLDLRSLRPLDRDAIFRSVSKTGRAAICDIGWRTGGIGGEIAALIAEEDIGLRAPLRRLALPDIPAPAARSLEEAFYLTVDRITDDVARLVEHPGPRSWQGPL
jgi:pyruvate dehydrogenase E1 component beta subunit